MRRSNIICLSISFLPFLLGLVFYNTLSDTPTTHVFSSSSASMLTKDSFLIILFFISIIYYVGSIIIADKFSLSVIGKISKKKSLRYLINIFFSAGTILLVLLNLKK